MNNDLQTQIQEYYGAKRLSPERVDALLLTRHMSLAVGRWKRIALVASIGCAAMALLALTLAVYRPGSTGPVVETPPPSRLQPAPEPRRKQDNLESQPSAATPQYRLVAFRSHNNACPYCRATAEVYAELEKSLDSPRLALEEFHLNAPEAGPVRSRIQELKLTALVQGRSETAFLALTTLDGELIKEFKPSQGSSQIASEVESLAQLR